MKTLKPLFAVLLFVICSNSSQAQTPDDSPAAREAALARLRKAAPCKVCDDAATMSQPYGSSCNSREFKAPPILAAPQKQWEINPGWWGVWPPFLVGNHILTGSCNNDGNEGLSAIDKNTGKTVWRIGNICATGGRRGNTGFVSFYELPSGNVLLMYPRNDSQIVDCYEIDVKAGRIVRNLTPAKRGPTRGRGGVLTVLNQTSKDGYSYISALSSDMSRVLWQNNDFRLAMTDKLDPFYTPTFSAPASYGGILFQTARSKDQPEPPIRQLHAIDLKTGKTRWRHNEQPVILQRNGIAYRSDDGIPMVADDKVIIRVQALLWPTSYPVALRALDMHTGKVLWTTKAVSATDRQLLARVAVCNMLVTEVKQDNGRRELLAYNLADGSLAWQRSIGDNAHLMASSGGAFYVGERIVDNHGKWKENRLQGFDGQTGTLLWTASLPDHFIAQGGERSLWDIENVNAVTPDWMIGSDGAIYGVTLRGAYKLK